MKIVEDSESKESTESCEGETWRDVEGLNSRESFLQSETSDSEENNFWDGNLDATINYTGFESDVPKMKQTDPFGLCVNFSVCSANQYHHLYPTTIDCGDLFSDIDGNVGSEIVSEVSHLSFEQEGKQCETSSLIVEFCSNINFKNDSQSDVCVLSSDGDGEEGKQVSHGSSYSLPLHMLRSGAFEINKLWQMNNWQSEELTVVHIIRQALNANVPHRLRVTANQEAESIFLECKKIHVVRDENISGHGVTKEGMFSCSNIESLDEMQNSLRNSTGETVSFITITIIFTNAL
jgi:hypothetical protein